MITGLNTTIVVLSILMIVLFYLQLNQGQPGGIQGLTGQDVELFKDNKEKKSVKIIRRITIVVILLIISLSAAAAIIANHTTT